MQRVADWLNKVGLGQYITTGSNDPVFVYHQPQPTGATGGEFDDQMTWITVGELMGKLVAAGRLP